MRSQAAPAVLAAAALVSALALASCVNDPDPNAAYFRLEADPSLVSYSRVEIQLADSLGNLQATLYDDTLPDVERLRHLPAGPYRGGAARIILVGYRGNKVAYRETRVYDGARQIVLAVDVFRDEPSEPVPPIVTAPVPTVPARHAPSLASLPGDTLVSIRDSVPLPAEAEDADADLAGYSWDCDGDGKPEATGSLGGSRAKIRYGRSFADSGTHVCTIKVWDAQGLSVQGKATVRVAWDAPTADAGRDTIVEVETPILLHAKGEDGFGPIVTREWKIGNGEFKHIPQQETSVLAPSTPGDLVCILRVTDSDSLSTLDTLVVKVVYHSDNTLADLRPSAGRLEPAFRRDVHAYVAILGATDSLLTLFPKPNELHARVAISLANAVPAASGALPIAPGENPIIVQVTAQDGSTLQYTVTARR
jgi:hypothetical protein